MEQSLDRPAWNDRAGRVLEILAAIAVLAVAALLLYTALTSTCRINPAVYESQNIQTVLDSWKFNLLVTACACIALRLLLHIPVSKKATVLLCAVLLGLMAAVGILYVCSAKALPMSDQGLIYQFAVWLSRGETAQLAAPGTYEHYYFVRFPFQLSFLSYMELLVRLFGERGVLTAAPVLNVLFLVSGYGALVYTVSLLTSDRRATLLTLFFLLITVQPLMSCTLLYGTIPALSASLWALRFTVSAMQQKKLRDYCFTGLFLALAIYMKPNAWIYAIAICLLLAVQALRGRLLRPLIAALLIPVLCLPLPKIAQKAYEARISVSFGKGYSMFSWMATCMQESWMASGWYNGYSQMLYREYGTDTDAVKARSQADIQSRLAVFQEDPAYAAWFYSDKFTTQWNEPSFESIWVSRVCEAFEERPAMIEKIYTGRLGERLVWTENYALQLLYAGIFLYALCLLRRQRKTEWLLMPVVLVGGVLFHILFEANAKYAVSYLPLFCPMAAMGILGIAKPLPLGRLSRAVRRHPA